jgi:hypothetical protein
LVDKNGNLVLLKKGEDGGYVGLMPAPKYKKPVAEEMLKKNLKSAEDKIRTLEIEKAYVFDAKGAKILSKSGDKSEVSFTTKEALKMKGNILTHNHPVGSSFSKQDIIFAISRELKEIRAVTEKHNHSFSLKGDAPLKEKALLEVCNEYDKANSDVFKDFQAKINNQEIDVEYANKNHYHIVWDKVKNKINWINYKREKIK